MILNRNKLYNILLIACTAGYIWLYYCITNQEIQTKSIDICFIKHLTNTPCPSCGSTRSVIALFQGKYKNSLMTNPLGIFLAIIMSIAPFWILFDKITKKNTLFNFYKKIEEILKKPRYAIPLIFLVIINWIWNITKGL